MKINDIIPGQANINKTGSKSSTQSAGNFQELLQNELTAAKQSEKTAAASAVQASQQVPPQLRIAGLNVSESTISTLDAFSSALADQRFTMAELEPFASALEEGTAALLDLKKQLPQDDPLAQLLDRVATVSYLESSKFRRGDYAD